MAGELATRDLVDRRRSFIGWVIAYVLLVVITVAAYRSIAEAPGLQAAIEDYPDTVLALMGGADLNITTVPGYLDSQLYAFMLPILFLVFAMGVGAQAVAGEQALGRLDTVLSYPVTRRRLLAERTIVLLTGLVFFAGVVTLSTLASARVWDMPISTMGTIAPNVMLVLLGAFFGILTLAVGAWSLSRPTAIAVSATLAGGSYLVSALAVVATWMEPLRPLSPFYWYSRGEPITDGLSLLPVVVLVAATAVAYVAADVIFERRDLAS
jgi:ABC-2 type transport system permease protein